MKIMLLAAVLITLPAVAALIYGLLTGNRWMVYAALASFGLNTLPFLAAFFLLKGKEGEVNH